MKVSVCLVAFQRAHSIGRTIESILGQEHGDLELLIHSPMPLVDGTEEVCRKYARLDSRVHFERNPANLGMPWHS